MHARTASADTPLQETRHILRKAHITVRGRRTRPPFGASQHLITSPPGHPREERTWVDGVKGGAPPGLAALSENASPAQRGPRREKTKMRAPISFSRRGVSIDTIFRIFFWNIEGPQQLRNPEYSAEYKRCLTTVLALQSGISCYSHRFERFHLHIPRVFRHFGG